jgi:hypothetical protein
MVIVSANVIFVASVVMIVSPFLKSVLVYDNARESAARMKQNLGLSNDFQLIGWPTAFKALIFPSENIMIINVNARLVSILLIDWLAFGRFSILRRHSILSSNRFRQEHESCGKSIRGKTIYLEHCG